MTEVYVYIENGVVTIETENRKVLHTMTGFEDAYKADVLIENLKNMYDIVEVYS